MNDNIIKLALDAGLINYIDNETPRVYYVANNTDIEEVNNFARSIIEMCIDIVLDNDPSPKMRLNEPYASIIDDIKVHFGLSD